MDKTKALANLKDSIACLEKNKLKYFIIDGTLLGAIREGDFIGHDTDIDIGVFMEEWSIRTLSDVLVDFMEKGFILYHSFGVFGEHFELSWRRHSIKVDFFFYYKHEDNIRFNAFLNGGRNIETDLLTYEYPAENFDNLIKYYFNGLEVIIPDDPKQILEIKYGKDWETPKKRWCWANDPCNKIS